MRRWGPTLAWLALATPALGQLVLLAIAIGGRFAYPYDLEWMEGGLLHHAVRLQDGDGIYGPPSVDFIPYLYTPLYPGVLAVLGSMFGLSYQLGRLISVVALVGIAVVVWTVVRGGARGPWTRAAATAGAVVALGLFAASYPFVEGWYDLVRADTLFLWMVTGGLALAHRTARIGRGWSRDGQARTAAAAALLALAFFCKQTGVLFVAAGGAIVLVANWRRAPIYAAVAAVIGLGGTWLLQRATGGWFWTYAYEIHQAHDWNVDRFWMAFGHILWRYPAATIAIAAGLALTAATAIVRRTLPGPSRTLLVWSFVYAVSTLVGAIGWGTEFAHFNAYMPAFLHGAIAAGAALPAIAACVARLAAGPPPARPALEAPAWDAGAADVTAPISRAAIGDAPEVAEATRRARRAVWLGQGAAAAAAVALGVTLVAAWWQPGRFIPGDADRRAGDALVRRMRAVEGEIWVPSHPWYAHLAGKRMYVHRMGVKDVTVRRPRPIHGLEDALRWRRFAAIFLDGRDLHQYGELPALARHYQEEDVLPRGERPRTVTGAPVSPESVWVPKGPPRRPPGATVVFDFEFPRWTSGWSSTGTAWGGGPVERSLPRQGPVRRHGGTRWATSFHGADEATGTLTSPPFVLDGGSLHLRLGGGTDPATLRVELLVDGVVVQTVTPADPPSERFQDVRVSIADWRGRVALLRFVDDATGAWGHLNVDEVLLVP